jgi:hypothetical protein
MAKKAVFSGLRSIVTVWVNKRILSRFRVVTGVSLNTSTQQCSMACNQHALSRADSRKASAMSDHFTQQYVPGVRSHCGNPETSTVSMSRDVLIQ